MRTHEVEGYSLAYETRGEGPPLLLVHGSLIDYRAWAAQMDAFGARFRTLAVSLRHCYPERWDGNGGDFTIERHARDLTILLDALAPGGAHLVGHSRGGTVAIQVALMRRDLVRRLVLADPGGLEALLPDTPQGCATAQESSAMFDRLRDLLALGDATTAARTFVDALGGPGAWDRRTAEQQQMLLDNLATGPHCAQRPRFTRQVLAGLPGPLLLVTGERSPSRYRLMLEALRDARADRPDLVVIPHAAHAMNRENPSAFNQAVLRFLASPTAGDP